MTRLPYTDWTDGDELPSPTDLPGDPEDIPVFVDARPEDTDLDGDFFRHHGWQTPDDPPAPYDHDDVPVMFDGYPDGYWDQRGEES